MSIVQIEDAHRFLKIHLEKIIIDSTSILGPCLRKVKNEHLKERKKIILLSSTHRKTNYTSNIHIFVSNFLPPLNPQFTYYLGYFDCNRFKRLK